MKMRVVKLHDPIETIPAYGGPICLRSSGLETGFLPHRPPINVRPDTVSSAQVQQMRSGHQRQWPVGGKSHALPHRTTLAIPTGPQPERADRRVGRFVLILPRSAGKRLVQRVKKTRGWVMEGQPDIVQMAINHGLQGRDLRSGWPISRAE
jgi:hypothetical protein